MSFSLNSRSYSLTLASLYSLLLFSRYPCVCPFIHFSPLFTPTYFVTVIGVHFEMVSPRVYHIMMQGWSTGEMLVRHVYHIMIWGWSTGRGTSDSELDIAGTGAPHLIQLGPRLGALGIGFLRVKYSVGRELRRRQHSDRNMTREVSQIDRRGVCPRPGAPRHTLHVTRLSKSGRAATSPPRRSALAPCGKMHSRREALLVPNCSSRRNPGFIRFLEATHTAALTRSA